MSFSRVENDEDTEKFWLQKPKRCVIMYALFRKNLETEASQSMGSGFITFVYDMIAIIERAIAFIQSLNF